MNIRNECYRIYNERNEKIAILTRWNRNLKLYEKWIEDEHIDWVEVSTIHSYIGEEKKTVFIVAYENPESIEEKKVIYTGMIRAKEQLIISTSFPCFDMNAFVDEDVVEVVKMQAKKSKHFKQLKTIKANKNLTLKKFENCMIDSISMTVKDIPYLPFSEHDDKLGYSKYLKEKLVTYHSTVIKVTHHKVYKNFTFTLQDVNLLRKSNYTDLQVVQFLSNFIMEFFNYQISLKNIKLSSIDICRVVSNNDSLLDIIFNQGIKVKTIRTNIKGEKPLQNAYIELLDNKTIYYNFTSTKTLTLAIYHPSDKENKNRYFNKNVTKLELRLDSIAIDRKYAFKGCTDIESLILMLKGNCRYIKEVFDRVIRFKKVKVV